MIRSTTLYFASLLTLAVAPAYAAVTADQAARLSGELTPFGSIKAGNADGSIPAYTGGLPNVSVTEGKAGEATTLKDPFAGEKPLVRIDATNVEQYKSKLSEGQMQLIKTRPGYYLNVYPSHRTAMYPDWLLKNTARNATTCKTLDNGDALASDCRGGLPFPIPVTGKEVMWNKLNAWQGPALEAGNWSYLMTPNGSLVVSSFAWQYRDYPYYMEKTSVPQVYARLRGRIEEPARQAGGVSMYWDYMDASSEGNSRATWSYNPGQRRVRAAPDQAYDTPNTGSGGLIMNDEIYMFTGKMDRWDMKLVGKQEMYIPYNSFKVSSYECDQKKALLNNFVNPECERWELHRVWVVEANLKAGARHVHKTRRYYFDEDNYLSGVYEAWDQSNKMVRYVYSTSIPVPELQRSILFSSAYYDFTKAGYFFSSFPRNKESTTFFDDKTKWPDSDLTPDAMQGAGIR